MLSGPSRISFLQPQMVFYSQILLFTEECETCRIGAGLHQHSCFQGRDGSSSDFRGISVAPQQAASQSTAPSAQSLKCSTTGAHHVLCSRSGVLCKKHDHKRTAELSAADLGAVQESQAFASHKQEKKSPHTQVRDKMVTFQAEDSTRTSSASTQGQRIPRLCPTPAVQANCNTSKKSAQCLCCIIFYPIPSLSGRVHEKH